MGFRRPMARKLIVGFIDEVARKSVLGLMQILAHLFPRPLSPPSSLLPRTQEEEYDAHAPDVLQHTSWAAPNP